MVNVSLLPVVVTLEVCLIVHYPLCDDATRIPLLVIHSLFLSNVDRAIESACPLIPLSTWYVAKELKQPI